MARVAGTRERTSSAQGNYKNLSTRLSFISKYVYIKGNFGTAEPLFRPKLFFTASRPMSTSNSLLEAHRALFEKATSHKLTQQLCAGTLPDRTLYVYLAQDLQFFQSGLRLLTKTTSVAPDTNSLLILAKKIGFFANDENSYFHECLAHIADALPAADQARFRESRLPQVDRYVQLLERTAKSETSYAKLITFVYCMELVYLQWPKNCTVAAGLHWKYQTWIDLHAGDHFETWCEFLQQEVDKCDYAEVSDTFAQVLQLELEFFEACSAQ